MWWWIGGAALVIAFALYLLLEWVGRRNRQAFRAEFNRIAERGQRLYCWIVKAEPELLTKPYFYPIFPYAGVVYTFDRSVPDLPRFLETIAARLRELHEKPSPSSGEKEIINALRPGYYGSLEPQRVPATLSDGVAVFLAAVYVFQDLLPGGRLDRPYLYAAAIEAEPTSEVAMLPYPGAEAEPGAALDPAP